MNLSSNFHELRARNMQMHCSNVESIIPVRPSTLYLTANNDYRVSSNVTSDTSNPNSVGRRLDIHPQIIGLQVMSNQIRL